MQRYPNAADLEGVAVLQVLPALETGGVERSAVEITEAVARAGGTALVASAGGRMVQAVERAGGRHIALPLEAKGPLAVRRNAARLAEVIEKERVLVVHARSRAPAWSAWLATRGARVRFVTTYHGVYGEGLPGKRRYNAVMARGERVIAASNYVAALVAARHGVPASRLRVIPRGVDPAVYDPAAVSPERMARLRREWRLPADSPVVILPARITRWKGHAVLLAALGRLHDRSVRAVFVGADQGRSRYVEALRRQATRLGLDGRLHVVGHCDDMPAALLLADVVVNPSVEPEAFGRTVIEAQAMARPVIAADHGGAAETIREGATGWRVPPRDAEALAAALDRVLAMPEAVRRRHGEAARAAVAAGYTTRAMQDATLAVYRELLG